MGEMGRAWSDGEINTLKTFYPTNSIEEIVQVIGRSRRSIQHKAIMLGLRPGRSLRTKAIPATAGPIAQLSDTELAYIAGIIDGEGYIGTIGRVQIIIGNTNKELMDWLAQRLGCNIYYRAAKNPHHSDSWQLGIAAGKVYHILNATLPYLVAKKQQALELIDHIIDS